MYKIKINRGIKGSRRMKGWKPTSKFNWVMQKSKFYVEFGLIINNWW